MPKEVWDSGVLKCTSCGQKIKNRNRHRIDKHKVTVLKFLHDEYKNNKDGWVLLKSRRDDCKWDEQVHAMRLKWFGLVEHGPKNRIATYRITKKGFLFLAGKYKAPSCLYFSSDTGVTNISPVKISIRDVKGIVLDDAYWNTYGSIQKA